MANYAKALILLHWLIINCEQTVCQSMHWRIRQSCKVSLTSNHIFLNKPKKPQPATRDFYKKRSPRIGNCASASATFYSTKSLSIKRRCSLSTDPPIITQKPGVQASPLLHLLPETLSVPGRDIIAAFIQ